MIDRRGFALGGALVVLAGCAARSSSPASDEAQTAAARAALSQIEAAHGGRLGAFVLDTGSGTSFGFRQGERFGMCSTFKLSLAALVLREADAGRLDLDEVMHFVAADLLPHSPVTGEHVAQGGMTVAALAEAAQLTSDNLAANLLLRRVGGPEALTRFWRDLGDTTSRADRYEPAMNLVPPGEVRDTVTPEGIARSAAKFVLGDVLAPASRARLNDWMARTETGKRRIRAGLPADWRGGDKTGTGATPAMANKYNDIAVLFPPDGRAPLVVTAFYEADGFYDDTRPQDEAALRQVGEVAVRWATR